MTAKSNGRSVSRRALLRLLSASASPLITACEGGAPNSSNSSNRSKEFPGAEVVPEVESPTDAKAVPMLIADPDDRTPFLLDFIGYTVPSHGHLRVEDGKKVEFYDTMTWTRLRSDIWGFTASSTAPGDDDVTGFVPPVFENGALAVQVVSRFYDKRPNEIIGLYSCRVEGHELHKLRRAIEGTPWSSLPHPRSDTHRDTRLTLRYSRGDVLIERGFTTGCWEFIDAIEAVWEGLMDVERKLRPLATLEIHTKAEPTRRDPTRHTLRVVLENRGTQPVAFTDPRIPFGDDRAFVLDLPRLAEAELAASLQTKSRIMIEVSQSDEGFMQMRAEYVPLPPLPADAPRTVVLAGRGKFEVEIPWVAPAPGSYWLRVRWFDFDGPIEPVPGQLPFMPIPEQGEGPLGGGPYPVRGTIFTDLHLEVPTP